MHILVITTGGTIGSTFDGASIDVSEGQSSAVVAMYTASHSDVTFTVQSPVTLLSESITAADFNTLARVILTAEPERYDGVIFTCGSDNLGYLAAFIGLLTGGWERPAAIVASDHVLSDPMANGYPNFCCAVELIRRGEAGAYVPYRNSDGAMLIHSATEIRQADLSPDFFSYGGAYAVFDKEIILNKKYNRQTIPAVFDRDHLPEIKDSVLMIHPYPLLDYTTLDLRGKRAVLHTLYHSSTLDSDRAIPFMERLGKVPMFLASFVVGMDRYRTAVDAIRAGAIPLTDISPECAYVKLLLACAQDKMSVRGFMGA